MKCPKCNTGNPQEANFCRYCGYAISSESNIYIVNQRLLHENDRLKNGTRFLKCPVKTHLKYILPIILFIIMGVLSCYYIYNKEEQFKEQIAFNKPFEILKIGIKDDYGKLTNKIRYDETTFIKPHLTVVGFKDGRYKIKAKVYRNSVLVPVLLHGWIHDTMILKRNGSSPIDCSFEGIYDITKGVITQFDMKEFGYEERGHWAIGDYIIEFWYDKICLGKEEFKISDK